MRATGDIRNGNAPAHRRTRHAEADEAALRPVRRHAWQRPCQNGRTSRGAGWAGSVPLRSRDTTRTLHENAGGPPETGAALGSRRASSLRLDTAAPGRFARMRYPAQAQPPASCWRGERALFARRSTSISSGQRRLQSLRNVLRALPCRPCLSASAEQAFDFAALASAVIVVGCAAGDAGLAGAATGEAGLAAVAGGAAVWAKTCPLNSANAAKGNKTRERVMLGPWLARMIGSGRLRADCRTARFRACRLERLLNAGGREASPAAGARPGSPVDGTDEAFGLLGTAGTFRPRRP